MNDSISRRTALETIAKLYAIHGSEGPWIDQEDALEALRSLPSAQSERKKGKWIKDIERFGDNSYHCSQCGAVLEKDDLEWRNNYYCYHCGLDMRGE